MDGQTPILGPAYRIITSRLIIRCLQPSDAGMMSLAISQNVEHLLPWMPWAKQEPVDIQQRLKFLRTARGKFDLDDDFTYGIFNPAETEFIGGTGLHTRLGEGAREIGYWIHRDFINQGFATEVAAALTRVAFEIDHVRRVEIHCDPRNSRSARVPEKLGFIHEATLHHRLYDTDGRLRDTMIWSLFAEDYPGSLPSKADIQAFDVIGRRLL